MAERVAMTKKERDRLRKLALKDLVRAKKDKPCVDCGVKYPFYVMQFDHTDPSQKVANVNRLVANRSMKKALAEIEKCEVVCANCHSIRTYFQNVRVAQR